MRIEYDVKLDFKDVLIRPKRSVLRSRAEVMLEREFRFKHCGIRWKGIPIIAANMDHTGTFAMASALSKHKLLTAMDKFHTTAAWQAFASEQPHVIASCFISVGITEKDFDHLKESIETVNINMICLDVANGYTELFVKNIRTVTPYLSR